MAGFEDEQKDAPSIEQVEHADANHHHSSHLHFDEVGLPSEISEEDNKRIKRKVDWVLMPVLGTITALQFLDKTMLAYSSIM